MKKVIRLTESDLKNLIKRVIEEQDEEMYKTVVAIQKFLNNRYKNDKTFKQLTVDGKTGPNSQTEMAIKKYQKEKRLDDDGLIGHDTMEAMRKDGLDKFESKFLGLF
jgi:hypothetical protein